MLKLFVCSRAAFYEIFDTVKTKLLASFEADGVNRVLDHVLMSRSKQLAAAIAPLTTCNATALSHSADIWEALSVFPSAACQLKCTSLWPVLRALASSVAGDSLRLDSNACAQPQHGCWQTATELFLSPNCSIHFSAMQLLALATRGTAGCTAVQCANPQNRYSQVCPASTEHTERSDTRWTALLRKARKLLRRTDAAALTAARLQGVLLLLLCCPASVQLQKGELVQQVTEEMHQALAALSPPVLAPGHVASLSPSGPLSSGELLALLGWLEAGRVGQPFPQIATHNSHAPTALHTQPLTAPGQSSVHDAAASRTSPQAPKPAVYTRKPAHAAHLAVKQPPSVASYGADSMWSGRGSSGFALKGLSALVGLTSAAAGAVGVGMKRPRSSSASDCNVQHGQVHFSSHKRGRSVSDAGTPPTSRAPPHGVQAVVAPATIPEFAGSCEGDSNDDQKLDTDGSDDGATLSADESQVLSTPVRSPGLSQTQVVDLTRSDSSSSSDSDGETLAALSRKAIQPVPQCPGQAQPGVALGGVGAAGGAAGVSKQAPPPALTGSSTVPTVGSAQQCASTAPARSFDAPSKAGGGEVAKVGSPGKSGAMSVVSDAFSESPLQDQDGAHSPPPDSQAMRALPPSPAVHGQTEPAAAAEPTAITSSAAMASTAAAKPALSKDDQHRIWPVDVPREVLQSVSPPLISAGSRALHMSPTPFLARVLAATMTWISADIQPASMTGDVKKPWWRWLGTPTNLHKELPPLPAPIAFQSMKHYAGYMLTMALEEVRAGAASSLERAGRVLRPAAQWTHEAAGEFTAGAAQAKALCDPRTVAGNSAIACRVMAVAPSKRGGGVDISVQTVQARPKQGGGARATQHTKHFFTGLVDDTNADEFSGVWGGRGITTRGLSSKNLAQNDMLLLVRWRPVSPQEATVVAEYMVGMVNLNALECTNEISHAERGRWRGNQRGSQLKNGAPLLADSATRWGQASAGGRGAVSASQVAYDDEQRKLREEAASIDSSTLVPVTVTFKGAASALKEYFVARPPKTQAQKDSISRYVQQGQLVLAEQLANRQAGPFWPASAQAVTPMSTWLLVPLTSATTALREYTGVMSAGHSCAAALLEAPVPSRCSSQFGVVASVQADWWKQAYTAQEDRIANPPPVQAAGEEVLQPTVAPVYTDRPAQVPTGLYQRLKASFNAPQLAAILAIARGGAVFQPYINGAAGASMRHPGAHSSRLPPTARASAGSSGGLRVVPGQAFSTQPSSGSGQSVHADDASLSMGNWGSQGCQGDSALAVAGLELTLVQGPPGTGKTTCIRGLVSVALSAPPAAVPVARPLKQKVGAYMLPGAAAADVAASRPQDPRIVPSSAPNFRNAAAALAADASRSMARPAPQGVFGVKAGGEVESEDPYAPPTASATQLAVVPPAAAVTVSASAPHPTPGVATVTPIPHLRRVLICAPSNAAVDQVVARIVGVRVAGDDQGQDMATSSGIWDEQGRSYKPSVVRLGHATTVAPELQAFTLESQVQVMLRASQQQNSAPSGGGSRGGRATAALVAAESDPSALQRRLDTCTNLLRSLKSELDKATTHLKFAEAHSAASSSAGRGGPHPQSRQAQQRVTSLKQQLGAQQRTQKQLQRELRDVRGGAGSTTKGHGKQKPRKPSHKELADAREKILSQAQIIACTLSGASGVELAAVGGRGFDLLIVDEACQACETSTLLPFVHRVRRVVLVGDPVQLPPTVISRAAESAFSRSLFERCVAGGMAVQQLRLQFRMHPGIREFPSNEFYGGVLKDGFATPTCAIPRSFIQPYHSYATFKPITFVDCSPRHLQQQYGQAAMVGDIGSYTAKTSKKDIIIYYIFILIREPCGGTARGCSI